MSYGAGCAVLHVNGEAKESVRNQSYQFSPFLPLGISGVTPISLRLV